jgi:hypothetical protein
MVYVSRGKSSDLFTLGSSIDSGRVISEPIYEALVEDVIFDQFHPEYSDVDGYNVGDIKVRIFSVDNSRDSELLDWASPKEITLQEYPLKGEIVILHKILGKFFYSKKINITHRLQEAGMLNLASDLNNKYAKLNSGVNPSRNSEMTTKEHRFGEYFKPDSRVRQLKHFEGDVILQGRMGQSIRFGSAMMSLTDESLAPNVILRTGQGKDVEKTDASIDSLYGLILEDVNKDASSIWMTSDQTVPFEPATVSAGSFSRSINNFPQTFNGAQLIANSDRLILNSKRNEILLFSKKGIHLNSFDDATIDTDNDVILTANIDVLIRSGNNIQHTADLDYAINAGSDFISIVKEKTSFISDKIHLGSVENTDEPMVGGTSISIFLARLIMTLMGIPTTIQTQTQANSRISIPRTITPGIATNTHVITPTGPGLLSPQIVTALTKLYNELATGTFAKAPFNSEDNFVMLQNETPELELNEFESGENLIPDAPEWDYTAPYYEIADK